LSAVAEEGAEGNEVGVRAEGVGQEAEGMEGLNPLTVEDISLVASREATGEVAADEAAMNPVIFEDLEEGDPIDAGGFHGDSLDAVFDEPIGEGVQVGGVDAEGAHDLGLVWAWDTDKDLLGADVGACGVGVDDGQALGGADFALGERGDGGFSARHGKPPVIKIGSGPATRVR